MTAILLVFAGAYGVHLLSTSIAFGWRGVGPGPREPRRSDESRPRHGFRDWLVQAGLDEMRTAEFLTVTAVLFVVGVAGGWSLFGGVVPPIAIGSFAASVPIVSYRSRRRTRLDQARDAWPRLIEEIRILTSSLGRSVPQALFEAGRRAPEELRPAFEAAHREWLLSTKFDRTLSVLKARLADATADAACENLLIAHELGGTDLDRRLEALADDRRQDAHGRKDARSRQAGARFARRFVLIVPVGMALAGLSVGTGRAAYQTPLGQLAVATGIAMVVLCWAWAGLIMRLPEDERVFQE